MTCKAWSLLAASLLLALAAPPARAQDDDWLAAAEAELDALEAAAGSDDSADGEDGADGGDTPDDDFAAAPDEPEGDTAGGDVQDTSDPAQDTGGAGASGGTPSPASDWQSALDRIADLLIEDRPADARAAAERLLGAPALPMEVEARARQLLATARRHLAAGSPAAEPRSGSTAAPQRPAFPSASFPVVLARIGAGFASGEAGSLRIDHTGVSFAPEGQRKPQWGVPWARVVDLTRTGGLWDTSHPLVLRQSDGPAYYLALVDRAGGYQLPDRLLEAFERARRQAQGPRRPAVAAAGGGQRR
ncbi:MAG TPA: hypothetical protein VHQ65_12030 [Thermoanaerobaculia bacterium]|nr:hypothetical protein [Thermoanaerobaculia bacterium]